MKNSIFKSYTKKILKSEAFVSVIIVFVLALGIIGTSYALYMDVDTDTDYQLVEVGDLAISFENPDGIINLDNMLPMDDNIALESSNNIFQFYLYNKGNYTANYDIKLETLDTNQVETKYINYQFCKDNAQNCDDVKTLSDGNSIYKDELSPKRETEQTNPSAYYFLRVWINNQYQSTEGKTISLKVTVDAKNASGYLDNKNTLAGAILTNPNIKINNDTPNFSAVEIEEKGLYKAQDDYGVSYYFRGAQYYNYVKFGKDVNGNDLVWRIVRINGDGSIRLIFNEGIRDEQDRLMYNDTNYNNEFSDNAYVGYMYGLTGATENVCVKTENDVKRIDNTISNESSCITVGGEWLSGYDATHDNIYSSNVKQKVDDFYVKYLQKYSDYLSDTMFCGDKSLANKNIKSNNTATGYGQNVTYYAAVERLSYNSSGEEITVAMPTFKCANNADNDYSRYTVDVQTLNNVTTNGDLTYPIGLLSADEIVFAGGWNGAGNTVNDKYYLSMEDGFVNDISTLGPIGWWTMTPKYGRVLSDNSAFSGHVFGSVNINGTSVSLNTYTLTYPNMIRPVINLKSDVEFSSGNGSAITPYIIK